MPTISIPVSDLLSSVERPIIFDVIRQLMQLTGISEKTTVRFYSDDAKGAQWGSYLTKHSHSQNLWPHLENVTIEVDEVYDPNQMLSMAVKENEIPFIFNDPALHFTIKPVYSPTDIIIRVVFNGKDKNQATRWRNEIRTRTAMGREINMHKLSYSYHLPEAYLYLIEHVYGLRSAIEGYGDSLNQYWSQCASDKFTRVTNQVGTHPILVVAETQSGVQGLFDFEGVPDKAEKEDEPDLWSVSFEYKFRYDKPINTVCRYPLLVHQQLIDEVYRIDNHASPQDEILKQLAFSGQAFQSFKGDSQIVKYMANKGITIPYFDDWLPVQGTVPSGTVKVFTAMACITPEDRRNLFNLRELGDFLLVKPILDFMSTSEYPYMTGHATSIFQLTLYAGHDVIPAYDFEVDASLNVKTTFDLDLRKQYHIRLGLHANIVGLASSALIRLRAWPDIVRLLASAINGALTNSGSMPDLRKNALNAHDLALLGLTGEAYDLWMQSVYGSEAGRCGLTGNLAHRKLNQINARNSSVPSTYGYSLFQTLFIGANRMVDYKEGSSEAGALERPFVNI